MGKIDLKQWFVDGNSLSISLLNYWVDINIKNDGNGIYIQMEVMDNNMQKYVFKFKTLGEAVDFTDNVIKRYKSMQKISIIYEEKYNKHEEDKKVDKIILTPDEVEKAIIDYFGFNKNYKVTVSSEFGLKNGKINVKYYLNEYLNYTFIQRDNKIRLTDGDIRKVLDNYIKIYDCKLMNFEYIGDVFKSDDGVGKDSIRYKGIELTIKKKEKILVLD
ncbi:MAG: hypothetical protein VZS44_06350 [Bacilli bacterium]|nr:hypothetical protein [Bacilli bacterium]